MNRRNFFGVLGTMVGVAVLHPTPQIREVIFNPPSQSPAIWWMTGHVTGWRMDAFCHDIGGHPSIDPSQVKYGWAMKRLSGGSLYLSNTPLPNYEPVTYWVPADWEKEAVS